MPTVLFVRHGRSSANTAGVLAGWTPGVFLDDTGEAQARAVGSAIAGAVLHVAEVVSSPLDRCVQTADLLVEQLGSLGSLDGGDGSGQGQVEGSQVGRSQVGRSQVGRSVHPGLGECHYGAWTGRRIADLTGDPLWKVVQDRPSEARFPSSAAYEAESLAEMQDRALRAVRETDAHVLERHGPDAVWVAVSHGDVIKSVLAAAAGAHLDDFQRFVVDPGSVSVVRYTSHKPFLIRVNDVGGDLRGVRPVARAEASGDAAVGGGAGAAGDL